MFRFFNGLQPTSAYTLYSTHTLCIIVNHVTFGRCYTAITVFSFGLAVSSFKNRFCRLDRFSPCPELCKQDSKISTNKKYAFST